MGWAWLLPGSSACAIMAWISTFLMLAWFRTSKSLRFEPFLFGAICNSIAFHWLATATAEFGGFRPLPAYMIYALFVVFSSLQYWAALFFFRYLPRWLDRYCLREPVAWVASEILPIRIFPWYLGCTQLAFRELPQIADIAGVPLVSFLMMWVCASLLGIALQRRFFLQALVAPALLGAAFLYGQYRISEFESLRERSLEIGLVQANVTIQEKRNIKYFESNAARYDALTEKIARPGMLVIWPESVIQDWVHTSVGSIYNDARLPRFDPPINLLTGALTYETQELMYNSALLIKADGNIPAPYHKRILMPFGEYTPLGEQLPWLRELNATAGNFTAGRNVEVFEFDTLEESKVRLSPLICYEDILPALSRDSVQSGAELLVNLTNDAWFGDTAAQYQHNLLASMRAIENRRFLVRSTNSGLTAVVNPLGETITQLPPYSEGTVLARVNLIGYKTLYTKAVGYRPWWVILVLAIVTSTINFLRFRRDRS
ncbi:MAG: apolipoprotein N-acyltransferase [Proteobacteria bacterium]|nr:MAG: apolipoprotein N-acyltransferase [Pseudomonadota bacterium]